MVIQSLLLITELGLFSTKYWHLNYLSVHSCSKKTVTLYFCLPYTGQHSLQLRTQLRKLLSSAYPHLSIRFVFRPTCRLSDFFPFKDRIPFALRSHVVYKYISVNAVAHCMLVKHTDIYTRESHNIWEFRPKLEISSQSHKCLLFWLTIISLNMLFLILTY